MAETPTIYVLNGPNLNLLGTREPEIYGSDTLDIIAERLRSQGGNLGFHIEFRQSNHEGILIDWIQEAGAKAAHAILINAAGYTHTSIAIHDALKAVTVPVFEVHLSDPHQREDFRHLSYVSMGAVAGFAGHGAKSYTLALDAAAAL